MLKLMEARADEAVIRREQTIDCGALQKNIEGDIKTNQKHQM